MSGYAKNTSVTIDRSMNQIRVALQKEGADGVAIAETKEKAVVQFVFESTPYKFVITYPTFNDDFIKYTGTGKKRTIPQMELESEKEKRRLWRAMGLYIKAAIEAHTNGLIDLKRSMMGNIMLPSGHTMYEKLEGNFDQIKMNPSLLIE